VDKEFLNYNTTMTLTVKITPGEDGWLVAEVPALPGCISQGKTKAETISNIKEAIEGWLLVEQSKLPPEPEAELIQVAI
jgi:predicted RNase H-like HicB family nuclease